MIGTISTSADFVEDGCSVNRKLKVKEIPEAIRKQIVELCHKRLTLVMQSKKTMFFKNNKQLKKKAL